jgi:hypothetical protein
MANNPYNDAKRGAHVVCKWGGVIEWRGAGKSKPMKSFRSYKMFQLVAKILYMATKHPIKSLPRICSGQ